MLEPDSAPAEKPVVLLGCGIFKREYELLPAALRASFHARFFDSMMHLDPERLDRAISGSIGAGAGRPLVLAFGDCCPHMMELGTGPGVARTVGVNCCEIYLGPERYKRLRKERVFFLMPEWAGRWERIVKEELGLRTQALARDFITQSMSRAVFIDTGTVPVPEETLAAFSEYTGLPITVERAEPDFLAAAIVGALAAARGTDAQDDADA